jgi:hypothetical protein
VDVDGGGSRSRHCEARKQDGMSSRGCQLQRRGGALDCHGRGRGSGSTPRRAPIEAIIVASGTVQRNPTRHTCWRQVVWLLREDVVA